jgi:hypothetical protein
LVASPEEVFMTRRLIQYEIAAPPDRPRDLYELLEETMQAGSLAMARDLINQIEAGAGGLLDEDVAQLKSEVDGVYAECENPTYEFRLLLALYELHEHASVAPFTGERDDSDPFRLPLAYFSQLVDQAMEHVTAEYIRQHYPSMRLPESNTEAEAEASS